MLQKLYEKKHELVIVFLLIALLTGCGLSPEEQTATAVALTAAAATDTPIPTPTSTPTPTPTPIPYDLSVLVTDEDGAPITGAMVVFADIDEEAGTQITDEVGQVIWYNLPGDAVNLSVSAQGYFPTDMSKTIERGPNEFKAVLERDPYGILPSEACAPGENLLYIEDFQDGEAQGWPEIELRTQEWKIVSDPENPGDLLVTRPSIYEGYANLQDKTFDNAVWRFEIMHAGKAVSNFSWHWHDIPYETKDGHVEWSAYPIWIHFPDIHVNRVQTPLTDTALRWTPNVLKVGVWHKIEISTYEGEFEFWVDGIQWVEYDDPEPLPEGRIVIGVGLGNTPENNVNVYFDDFVICELTAPFTTMPTPEPNP